MQVEFQKQTIVLEEDEGAILFKHDSTIEVHINGQRTEGLVPVNIRVLLVTAALLDTENHDLWTELKDRVERKLEALVEQGTGEEDLH
jgi:hypothetical protein